jgi:NMD protein affecting ribosome stability and mRNA decay
VNVRNFYNSKDFKTAIENGEVKEEMLVDSSENESVFTDMIKFLYTGTYDYSKEEEVVTFIIYANNVIFFV